MDLEENYRTSCYGCGCKATPASQVKCFIWGSAKCQNKETVMDNIIRLCLKVIAKRRENGPFNLTFIFLSSKYYAASPRRGKNTDLVWDCAVKSPN